MSNKKFVPGSSKIKEIENKQPVKNFLRLAVGQGFGFGFGDEIEASFRSAFSEKSYEEIVKQVRDEIDEYRAENPAAAISQEIAGSLIPTIALSVFGGPAGISAASTRYGQIINTLSKAPIKTQAGLAGLYGFGASEGSPLERAPGAAISAGIAAPITAATRLVGPVVTQEGRELIQQGANLTPGQAMGASETLIGKGLKLGEEVLESLPGVGTRVGLERGITGFNKVVLGEVADIVNLDKNKFKNLNLVESYKLLDDSVNDFYKKSAAKLKLKPKTNLRSVQKQIKDVIKQSDLTEGEKLKAYARVEKFTKLKSVTPKTLHDFDKSLSNRVFKGLTSADPDQREIAIVLKQTKDIFDNILDETPDYVKAKDAYAKTRIIGSSVEGEELFTPQKLKTEIKKSDKTRGKKRLAAGEAKLQDVLRSGKETVQKELGSSGTAERLLPYLAVGAGAQIDPLFAAGVAGYGGLLRSPAGTALLREGLNLGGQTLRGISPITSQALGVPLGEQVNLLDLLNQK
jgi:hypothetical protein